MTWTLRFDDSAKPAIERLLDCLGLEIEWKDEMALVSTIQFEFEAALPDAAPKEALALTASASPTAKPLHPGG